MTAEAQLLPMHRINPKYQCIIHAVNGGDALAKGIGLHSVKYYEKAVHHIEKACKIIAEEFPVDYVECVVTLRDEVKKMIEG